jgi:hypothetical protein
LTVVEGHEVTFYLSLHFFTRCLAKKTKGNKKLLMAKKKPEFGPVQRRKPQELLWLTAWAARSLSKII